MTITGSQKRELDTMRRTDTDTIIKMIGEKEPISTDDICSMQFMKNGWTERYTQDILKRLVKSKTVTVSEGFLRINTEITPPSTSPPPSTDVLSEETEHVEKYLEPEFIRKEKAKLAALKELKKQQDEADAALARLVVDVVKTE